jgi:CRISPR/Cas system CSM-associated protein Csm3 (group 7 of RAMP superfamily)
MFKTFENRVIIQYRVVTMSDLHIGSHGSTAPAEVDSPVIKTVNGTPFIPGSSLKGVLRTEFERLLRGCHLDVCMVPDVCGSKKRKDVLPCPVCTLFGGMDLAGSVRIADAFTPSSKTMIRDGVGIDRKTRKAKDKTKYDVEVVPKGTTFTGTVVIENLAINNHPFAKLGGFLSLVRFFNATSGRIGHATSRGFGKIDLLIDSVSILTPQDYLKGHYDGTLYAAGNDEFIKLEDSAQENWRKFLTSLPQKTVPG